MNEINPSHRFALDAVRKFEGGADAAKSSGGLNAMARQVATQYRRDTTSPVMVSGVLRLVEFGMLFLTGLVLYAISFGFHLSWQYPAIILTGSLLTVILLEFTDCYQISALLRPRAEFRPPAARLVRHIRGAGRDRLLHEGLVGLFAHVVRQLVRHRLGAAVRAAGW